MSRDTTIQHEQTTEKSTIVVQIKHLSKNFGDIRALNDLNFEMGPGIWGLIGPNGAGKTTLLSIMSGLLKKSSGEINILGYDPTKDDFHLKSQLSFCLTNHPFPREYTSSEYLQYIMSSYSIAKDLRTPLMTYMLKKLELDSAITRNIYYLSSGTKQKLAIAQTLLSLPKIALLDEPFANLDPHIKVYTASLIKEFYTVFKTTFVISSHNLEDLSSFCSHYLFINEGKLVWQGESSQIPKETIVDFYMKITGKSIPI